MRTFLVTLIWSGLKMSFREYEEHHYQGVEDVGIAFNHDRVWVCINGAATLRAMWRCGELFVEFTPPKKAEHDAQSSQEEK